MEIRVKVTKLPNPKGKTVAFASATIAESFDKDGKPEGLAFAVNDLNVVDGKDGLFVGYPQRSYKDKDGNLKYANIVVPVTAEGRAVMDDTILAEAKKILG